MNVCCIIYLSRAIFSAMVIFTMRHFTALRPWRGSTYEMKGDLNLRLCQPAIQAGGRGRLVKARFIGGLARGGEAAVR